MSARKVAIIHSSKYNEIVQLHPTNTLRYKLWANLAQAYGLLVDTVTVRIVAPIAAKEVDLLDFHSMEYISCVKRLEAAKQASAEGEENQEDNEDLYDYKEAAECGLVDDCPVFKGLHQYMLTVVGGTLSAVDALLDGSAHIAINWAGGRHHAKRSAASGFCYVNDVVIGILRMLDCPRVTRVLYIDIDVHHGDGVQEAFWDSASVFTLSFHHHEPGFFPGTGYSAERGVGEGSHTCLNVPLKAGIGDHAFCQVVAQVSRAVFASFKPDMIVVQCGCDTLAFDRLGTFNLTSQGVKDCVANLLEQALPRPVLLVGGGGYHAPSVARCWTTLTALAANIELDPEIPDHENYCEYRPDFSLHSKSNPGRFDAHQPEEVKHIIQQAIMLSDQIVSTEAEVSHLPSSTFSVADQSTASIVCPSPSKSLENIETIEKPLTLPRTRLKTLPPKRARDEFEFDVTDEEN